MKKIFLSLFVAFTLLLGMNVAQARTISDLKSNVEDVQKKAIQKFSDVKSDSWFLRNVALLSELGVVNGYDDGTFKPSTPLTKAQFIKMMVVALGNADLSSSDTYWARTFIVKAQSLGLVDNNIAITPANYDVALTRGEMSTIIVKTLQKQGEVLPVRLSSFQNVFPDYTSISDNYKSYVITAYLKGILAGYEDGNFKAGNTLTRAEAATVIVRMLDKSERLFQNTLVNEADIARLKAYTKAGDGIYSSLPDVDEGADFGEYYKVELVRTEESVRLVEKFLLENREKYNLKDVEFYTNKELAYNTKKGIVRMRGIIDGADQEIEFGTLKDGTYAIVNIIELK